MLEEIFCEGDICEIVELGEGAFHWDAKEHFKGKRVVFVKYDSSKFAGGDFVACILRLLENICTNKKSGEYMLEGHEFCFLCVKLKKAT